MQSGKLVEAEQVKYLENIENLPADYWQLQKLIKYIATGSYSSTLIGLVALKDFDLNQNSYIVGLKYSNGIATLLNLLDTSEERCILGALDILSKMTENMLGCILLSQYDGVVSLLKLLHVNNDLIISSTCSVLSNSVKYYRNQSKLKKANGLKTLVAILNDKYEKEVGEYAVQTLLLCGQSTENIDYLIGLSVLFYDKLISSGNKKLVPHVVGILATCTVNKTFREQLRASGLLLKVLQLFDGQDRELSKYITKTIGNCAQDALSREMVMQSNGLVKILENIKVEDLELSNIAFQSLTNVAVDDTTISELCKLKLLEKIVVFLGLSDEIILINVLALVFQISSNEVGRKAVKNMNILPKVIEMMKTTNIKLLEQITLVLGACASDTDMLRMLYEKDGVRYMWSLLKSKHPELQAAAARSIGPCVANIAGGGDLVRSFVGGIELIVNLLKSDNTGVLVNVCRAIVNISQEKENLEVITDQGVIGLLGKLQHFEDVELKKQLCMAIASCSKSSRNRIQFQEQGLIAYVIRCLKEKDFELQKCATIALRELSLEGFKFSFRNCLF